MTRQNGLLIVAVVLITALPLWWVAKPAQGEKIFEGADGRAQQLITELSPPYQPWFSPVLEPASGEIASLLFALQAAIGAGFIGYWLGVSVTREKCRRENKDPSAPRVEENERRAD